MNLFYFGPSERALFGSYHPPVGEQPLPSGVVLCYPFGREYLRAHRAFRQLAIQLARAGFHVLRFDYYGTGDSAGESDDGDLDTWRENVSVAADELKDTAGVGRVSLVGLRLGATVAFRAAVARDDVDDLVLWNPIVRGAAHTDELFAANVEWATSQGGGPASIWGFPMTGQLQAGVRGVDLLAEDLPGARRVHLVVSEEKADYTALAERMRTHGRALEYRHVPATGWSETDEVVTALVPTALVHDIVRGLARRGAVR